MDEQLPELSPEEERRALLHWTIPRLPSSIADLMLAMRPVQQALGLPEGDFIRLWGKRFDRGELFECLRAVASKDSLTLQSSDGEFQVEEGWIEDDGSVCLRAGKEICRFAHAGLLSGELGIRTDTFEKILALGRLNDELETRIRHTIENEAIGVELFIELDAQLDATPESVLDEIERTIPSQEATFEVLVPTARTYFQALLGCVAPPSTLQEFKDQWLQQAAKLDQNRLRRLLKISAPISVLSGGLIATAGSDLPPDTKKALMQQFRNAPEPFSQIAAFEIASTELSDPVFSEAAEQILDQICDHTSEIYQAGGTTVAACYFLTTAFTARNRLFEGWPIYASRLARLVHACHLTNVFAASNVETSAFNDECRGTIFHEAQLADALDAQAAPQFQSRLFGPGVAFAEVISRTRELVSSIGASERPSGWLEKVEASIAAMAETGSGLFLSSPGPFDEFEPSWPGRVVLPDEQLQDLVIGIEGDDPSRSAQNTSLALSIAFDIKGERQLEVGSLITSSLHSMSFEQRHVSAEFLLPLFLRWRKPELADKVMDHLFAELAGSDKEGFGPTLSHILLAAAACDERGEWFEKARVHALRYARAQANQTRLTDFVTAIDILSDQNREMGERLRHSRAFAALALSQ